jgi:hypothetical protein
VTGPRGERGVPGAGLSDQPHSWAGWLRTPFRPITRGAAQAFVFLSVLTLLLAGASSWVSVRAVQGEVRSRASVVQLCQAGNDSRAQQVTLWTHLVAISAPPPHQSAAQKAARDRLIARFLAFVRKVFAPRDCTANFKG